MRAKKAALNSVSVLIYEIIAVICGLILPRLILSHFGSDYNGVTASISQFIAYVTLLSAGVGGVTQAALYKPLAEHDINKISGIIRATEIFMRKVALIFVGGLVVFALLYPFMVSGEFDWLFTFTLVMILGIGTFVRYFFGITYRFLFNADQRSYIPTVIHICTTVLNTIVASVLILSGFEIRVVKLASALVFCIDPLLIYLLARKRYKINRQVLPDNSAIKQRWDAFAQQVANFVQKNTDIVILTIFTGIWEVSVYAVYFLIIRNIKTIITSLMGPGIGAAFGNMLAKNEQENVQKNLQLYEFLSNSLSVLFFTCTAMLIVPFIEVYTKGIVDVDYYRPMFAYIACGAQFFFVLRLPYQALVKAAGHFKQTRNGAIVEMCLNIVISTALVYLLGLVGVVIGSLVAMLLRTLQYAKYSSRYIVKRSFWLVIKKLLLSIINVAIIVIIVQILPAMSEITYTAWVLHALPVFSVALGITGLFAILFYREEIKRAIVVIKSVVRKKKV